MEGSSANKGEINYKWEVSKNISSLISFLESKREEEEKKRKEEEEEEEEEGGAKKGKDFYDFWYGSLVFVWK